MSANSDLIAEARTFADGLRSELRVGGRIVNGLADSLAASEQRIAELEAALGRVKDAGVTLQAQRDARAPVACRLETKTIIVAMHYFKMGWDEGVAALAVPAPAEEGSDA